jgi:hypothetical protein
MPQIPTSGFSGWLLSDAGAGWVFGLVSTAGLVVTLVKRKRPRQIAVREVAHPSLVRVRPDVRERIAVTFDGAPVSNPGQIDFDIANDGADVIQRPVVRFTFPAETRVLDAIASDADANSAVNLIAKGSSLSVEMAFLNPFKEHGQRVMVSVVVDGTDQDYSVSGGGEGWSIRSMGRRDPAKALRRIKRLNVAMLFVTTLAIPYGWWATKHWGLDQWRFGPRELFASLPFIVPFFALQIAILSTRIGGRSYRALRRTRDLLLPPQER